MKDLLLTYTSYEQWANEALLGVALSLSVEEQRREITSSFPSVHKTLLHMLGASSIWWQRLQRVNPIVPVSQTSDMHMDELAGKLLGFNQQWHDWLTAANEQDLLTPLTYITLAGDSFTQPLVDIILHLNNHGTYHRGQLVTMFRQLGVTRIPQTDYILYRRINKGPLAPYFPRLCT